MQLLYTGAEHPDEVQPDPAKSLGGLISRTPVPNGTLQNIFPTISKSYMKGGISDVRLIAIVNNSSSALTNVRIWTVKGALTSYQIAAVSPATNSLGYKEFEQLANANGTPYQATLSSHETEDNALVVGTVAANAIVGIWIKRDIDLSQFNQLDGIPGAAQLTNDQLQTLLESGYQNAIDETQVIIDWQ